MTPRRIALVGHSYPPLVGGATRATWQVAQRDVAVTVANAWHRDTDAYEMDGRVQVVHRLRSAVSRIERLRPRSAGRDALIGG